MIVAQRLPEHAIEPQLARIAEFVDADGHAFMPRSGLRSIGAEQAIPPGQIEAEIAVGFLPVYRVVHAVHVRSSPR